MIAYLITILTLVGIVTILGLALNLQWGLCGMVNFGMAGFFALGAYTAALVALARRRIATQRDLGGLVAQILHQRPHRRLVGTKNVGARIELDAYYTTPTSGPFYSAYYLRVQNENSWTFGKTAPKFTVTSQPPFKYDASKGVLLELDVFEDEITAKVNHVVVARHKDTTSPIPQYPAGSEGPPEADALQRHGHKWRTL